MIICVCKRVNSTQVQHEIRKGANSVEELSEALGLGTGCGRCVEYAQQMVDRELAQSLAHNAAA